MEMKKKGLDRDTIIVCGIISLVVALGIIFFILCILGLDVMECDSTGFVSALSVISAVTWTILLCRNC